MRWPGETDAEVVQDIESRTRKLSVDRSQVKIENDQSWTMKQVVSQTQRRSDVASNDNPSSKDVPASKGKRKERRKNSKGSWKAPTENQET